MHSAKRYLLIALSFAICMLVFAAFAPRIAHAVTATLVQVVNGYSNPAAVVHADNDGRNVVRVIADGPFTSGSFGPGSVAFLDDTTDQALNIPPGKRLVVDNISADATVPTGQGVLISASDSNTSIFVPMVKQFTSGGFDIYVSSGVSPRLYVDSGSPFFAQVARNSTDSVGSFNVHIVGHLVDCTNGGGC